MCLVLVSPRNDSLSTNILLLVDFSSLLRQCNSSELINNSGDGLLWKLVLEFKTFYTR